MFELIPIDRHIRRMPGFDPFRELEEMERSFFGGMDAMPGFRTDVRDTGDAFQLECELPGYKKEDISIDIENDCLTISAQRKANEERKDNSGYIKRERFYGSCSRCFDVSGVEIDGIEASYNDGILTLTMPKRAELMPVSRKLEIK